MHLWTLVGPDSGHGTEWVLEPCSWSKRASWGQGISVMTSHVWLRTFWPRKMSCRMYFSKLKLIKINFLLSPSLSSYFLEGQQAKPRGSRERRAPHSDQGVGVPQIYNQKLRGEDSLFSFTGPSNLLWRTHLLSILLLRNPLFHDLSLSFILSIH